ncbi:MAG: hypothetical protein DHS20C15_16120 [Planctomycetota bacterium]|nr:MAG: hypothetical protein DHS20C15_16120 [Planctomycetota bacterium]
MVGIGLLLVVVVLGAWYVSQSSGQLSSDGLSRGDDLMAAGQFDEAIAAFASVPADAPTYAQAQTRKQEAEQRKSASAAIELNNEVSAAYQFLVGIRKSWVDRGGKGFLEKDYVPNARYLLKRAQEFLQRFPEGERSDEVRGWTYYYAEVTSLDTPPTEDDVIAEIKFRTTRVSGTHRDYAACMRAISEFASQNSGVDAEVLGLRGLVQADVDKTWKQIEASRIAELLGASPPNWQKVANATKTFLDAVALAPGLVPPIAAVDLLAKAQSQPDPAAGG